MGCRGVHFAITEQQAQSLIDAPDDATVMEIIDSIEENEWETGLHAETDKAWDAIHRAMTDGSMTWDGGEEPLKWVILGGRRVYQGDDYIATLLTPAQVKAVAEAIAPMDEKALRKRYDELVPEDFCLGKGDEDFEYTWHWFNELKQFFQKAADAQRHVIFTADQ